MQASSGRIVLVIMSSEGKCDLRNGSEMQTGFYLNELTEPLMHLIDEGFVPVFANPKGNQPPMDPRSNSLLWFKGNKKKYQRAQQIIQMDSFVHPMTFQQVLDDGLDKYSGLFIPGGHAPMQDLAHEKLLGTVLKYFHEKGLPIAAICHGPAALIAALDNPDGFLNAVRTNDTSQMAEHSRDWPFRGYKMTCFSNIEENTLFGLNCILGPRSRPTWYCETALRECGASYSGRFGAVCKDRELFTATDPLAADRLGLQFREALLHGSVNSAVAVSH
eukprot:ANDGO_01513.mRNA.1 hypothetical protein